MKKILFLSMVFILFISLISSVDYELKEEYNGGETLIAKISANFINPPLEKNILFYREHVRVPLEPNLIKINDEFYLWAQLPQESSNYSIQISDVSYREGAVINEDDLMINFTISNESSLFSFSPGVVYTNKSFDITIQNLHTSKIEIQSLLEGQEKNLSLKSGDFGTMRFQTNDLPIDEILDLKISSNGQESIIPIYLYSHSEEQPEPQEKDLDFSIPNSNIVLTPSSEVKKTIYLKNEGLEDLEEIEISLSKSLEDFISLSPTTFDLDSNESKKIILTIISGEDEGVVEGEITARTEGIEISRDITLSFVKGYIPSEEDNSSLESCFDITNGKFCTVDQTCSVNLIDSFEGKCCTGVCNSNSGGSTGKIIGWTLLVIITVFLIWFFLKKYRGASRPSIDLVKLGSR